MSKSRFPVKFKKCPNCGSTKTLTKLAWDEEAEKGRVKKDTPVALQQLLVPLIDPKKPPILTASALNVKLDICAKCGTGYCRKAEVATGPIQMGQALGQKGGRGSFQPRGFG